VAEARLFRIGDAMSSGGVCDRLSRGPQGLGTVVPPVPGPELARVHAACWSMTATR
jgi:hypothetical protein